ncbi:MAG: TolC family protein [Capsulimonadaceae bacterium]
MRLSQPPRFTAALLWLAWAAAGVPAVSADPPASATTAPSTTAPSMSTDSGATGPGTVSLTLDQALARALAGNSSVALARERLRVAQEQIKQAFASAMPQFGASVADTYSSVPTVAAEGGSTAGSTISLPGGGTIPVITDQGGGSGSAFVGGGGGGNVTTPATGDSSMSTAPVVTGLSTMSTSSTASTNAAPPSSQMIAAAPAPLPPELRQYAAADGGAETPSIEVPEPRQPGGGGGGSGSYSAATEVLGSKNNYAARISLNQAVDIFGLVPASLDVLRRTRDFYTIDLDRVSNELALTVKTDFYTVLRDDDLVATASDQVSSATENLRITQAEFGQGTAAEYDVLTAQTTLANDQEALSTQQNQRDLDLANLNSLIGVDLDQPVTLVAPALPSLTMPIDLAAAQAAAFKNRPEIRQANNNIAMARRLVKLSGSGLLPALTVSGAASYSGPIYPYVPSNDYAVTANLGVPLYDGGLTRSKVRSAQADLNTQLVTRAQLLQSIALEIRQAYLSAMNARANAAASQTAVTQATDAARLASVRYKYGQGTFLDVINAEAQLSTARTNLATAQFNYQTALAQLLRSEGGR